MREDKTKKQKPGKPEAIQASGMQKTATQWYHDKLSLEIYLS